MNLSCKIFLSIFFFFLGFDFSDSREILVREKHYELNENRARERRRSKKQDGGRKKIYKIGTIMRGEIEITRVDL